MSKKYFNQLAPVWDQKVNHDPDIIKPVLDGLPDIKEAVILDAGSGTGVMIPYLKERYGKKACITELDFAEKMIKMAREKHDQYSNIDYIVGDVYQQPFPEEKYNLIICYSVFPHFKDHKKVLQRFYDLLKKGGRLVIFHSDGREVINNIHREGGAEVSSDHLPPASVVAKMARGEGYSVEKSIDREIMYLLELVK